MSTATADSVIRQAMEDAGLLQEGSDPSSEQFVKYLARLNLLLKFMQTQGVKLWLQSEQAVMLIAGQATYTMKPGGNVNIVKPLRVLQGYYLEPTGDRRPIDPSMSRDEYMRLSNVSNQGSIISYFIDKKQDQLDVSFWLTPDAQAASGSVRLLVQRQISTAVLLTDILELPDEWGMPLHWGLADEICTGQPQAIVDRCAARAALFRDALEAWDVEDASTSFQPDSRMSTPGAFR